MSVKSGVTSTITARLLSSVLLFGLTENASSSALSMLLSGQTGLLPSKMQHVQVIKLNKMITDLDVPKNNLKAKGRNDMKLIIIHTGYNLLQRKQTRKINLA